MGALLPKALVGTSAAAAGGRITVLGGSGPAGFNATIYAFTPGGGGTAARVAAGGQLPQALHDAGAAASGTDVLLCGGGQSVGTTTVYRVAADGGAALAGHLPQPLSDLEGVSLGGRPYCLGGWTGTTYSDAVYDLSALGPSSQTPPVVAHLPHAVRYSAAAALPGGILVAGGLTSQTTTTDIQWVPLGAGAAAPAVVGTLPRALQYAMGAALDGTALVIGGCDASGTPTDAILAVTPRGAVTPVGRLPAPLCYGSAATLGGAVYVFGGETTGALASNHVWRIVAGS